MLKSWRTSVAGLAAFLVTWLPLFQQWFEQNKAAHVGEMQWIGLLMLTLGLLAKDHNITGGTKS